MVQEKENTLSETHREITTLDAMPSNAEVLAGTTREPSHYPTDQADVADWVQSTPAFDAALQHLGIEYDEEQAAHTAPIPWRSWEAAPATTQVERDQLAAEVARHLSGLMGPDACPQIWTVRLVGRAVIAPTTSYAGVGRVVCRNYLMVLNSDGTRAALAYLPERSLGEAEAQAMEAATG